MLFLIQVNRLPICRNLYLVLALFTCAGTWPNLKMSTLIRKWNVHQDSCLPEGSCLDYIHSSLFRKLQYTRVHPWTLFSLQAYSGALRMAQEGAGRTLWGLVEKAVPKGYDFRAAEGEHRTTNTLHCTTPLQASNWMLWKIPPQTFLSSMILRLVFY